MEHEGDGTGAGFATNEQFVWLADDVADPTVVVAYCREQVYSHEELPPADATVSPFHVAVIVEVPFPLSTLTFRFAGAFGVVIGMTVDGRNPHVTESAEVKVPPWLASTATWYDVPGTRPVIAQEVDADEHGGPAELHDVPSAHAKAW